MRNFSKESMAAQNGVDNDISSLNESFSQLSSDTDLPVAPSSASSGITMKTTKAKTPEKLSIKKSPSDHDFKGSKNVFEKSLPNTSSKNLFANTPRNQPSVANTPRTKGSIKSPLGGGPHKGGSNGQISSSVQAKTKKL